MPTIAIFGALYFFLWAYDLRERAHVHIAKGKGARARVAKIWLDNLEFAETGDLTAKEQKLVTELVEKNKEILEAQIAAFSRGEKIKRLKLKL